MLKSIALKNFQQHKKLKLEFGPITVFVGQNGKGKSTIIRALKWAMLNKPRGTDIIRWGAKDCAVGIEFDDHTLIRRRTGRDNFYFLDNEELKAFGSDVPEPIANILDVSELNFQGQHDSSFWLSLTPSAVTKELNRIVDMSAIDELSKKAKSYLSRAKTVFEYESKQAKKWREKVKSLRGIEEQYNHYTTIQGMAEDVATKGSRLTRLRGLLLNLTTTQGNLKTASLREKQLTKLCKKFSKVQAKRTRLARLEQLADNFTSKKKELECRTDELRKIELRITALAKSRCPACGQLRGES
jgi:DNA repair protein SbcC/Rad50